MTTEDVAGRITGIYLAGADSGPTRPVEAATAVPGKGLDGDRYAAGTGFYSQRPRADRGRELTFIAAEAVAAAAREAGVEFTPAESRRNLVTEGVDLDALVGRRLGVGGAVIDVVDLCPPCAHLEEVTGKPVMRALLDRGGLRTRIVEAGEIRVGDGIRDLGPISD